MRTRKRQPLYRQIERKKTFSGGHAVTRAKKLFSRLEPIPGVRLPKVVYAMNRTYASIGQEPEVHLSLRLHGSNGTYDQLGWRAAMMH